jgi:hypothetical protein
MLPVASFSIISSKKEDLYYGFAAKGRTGLKGELLDRYIAPTLTNLSTLLDIMSKSLLLQDDLEVPRGHKISTEEDRKRILTEILTSAKEEGFCVSVSEWRAQKIVH